VIVARSVGKEPVGKRRGGTSKPCRTGVTTPQKVMGDELRAPKMQSYKRKEPGNATASA